MGFHAVNILVKGSTNRVVCERAGKTSDIDIAEALSMKKGLDEDEYSVLEAVTGIGE